MWCGFERRVDGWLIFGKRKEIERRNKETIRMTLSFLLIRKDLLTKIKV